MLHAASGNTDILNSVIGNNILPFVFPLLRRISLFFCRIGFIKLHI